MSTLEDTEDKLPGLRFHVLSSSYTANSTGQIHHGCISLKCEVTDKEMWTMAIDKFEGFKVFSSLTEEVQAALGYALDSTDNQLQMALEREKELLKEVLDRDNEIARLQQILHDIGVELGVE